MDHDTNGQTAQAQAWEYSAQNLSIRAIPFPAALTHRVVLSASGRTLAVASSNEVLVLDVPSGQPLLNLTQSVASLAFDPAGQRLAVAGAKRIQVWDLK